MSSFSIKLYRIARYLYLKDVPLIPDLIKALIYLLTNSIVPYTASIGDRTILAYGGIGVVIHSKAIIGSGCTIGQNVTIGRRVSRSGAPVIGDSVYIAAGARIIGSVRVGSNSIIGANSVVTSNLPPNSVSYGVPARVQRLISCSISELLDV